MKKFSKVQSRWLLKSFYVFLFTICLIMNGFSQAVISTIDVPAIPSAGLVLDFTTKGMLLSRVSLTGTTIVSPLPAHIPGMIVYNTATIGNVKPGIYCNDGSRWLATMPPPGNASGDLQYWDGNAWVILPAGQPGQKLQLNSAGIPAWSNGGLATLTTFATSQITSTTASSGGNITSDGGIAVTARGICWNTASSPTTSNSKTTDGSGSGSFTSNLTGLSSGTIYYIRAYATNTNGTAYGNEVSFTTP